VGIRKEQNMNETADNKVGAISLWASILGIVVPILIAFLVRLSVKTNDETYYMLCILLFVGAEMIALITGIIGRKTAAGKAGIGTSLVCVLLTALAITMFTSRPSEHRSGRQQPTTSGIPTTP
ncbi:MAG: hypothetical protein ACO3M2_13165, partial [Pseudohongiellaceae bacterium]